MKRDLRDFARRSWFAPIALLLLAFNLVSTVVWVVLGRWADAAVAAGLALWIALYVMTEMTVSRKNRDIEALAKVLLLGGYR